MTTPVSDAARIPVGDPTAVVTCSRVSVKPPDRPVPLEIKVSAPETGSDLPIILLSHGHGGSVFLSSLHGYAPLAEFWAAHGFVVIQPTHLDSGTLGLRDSADPDAPLFCRARAQDMHTILDDLEGIESATPGLAGRLDRGRVAAAGHSLGGLTTAMLLGARIGDPENGGQVDLADARVRAGVLLAAPGDGRDLAEWASRNYPVLRHVDFSTMTAPALVVAGDADLNPDFSDRLSYRWDAYTHSPGPKSLLTLVGAEHMLGGVSGYDAAETTDENPERVAMLRALAWAYLRTALDPTDPAWVEAVSALETSTPSSGRVEVK